MDARHASETTAVLVLTTADSDELAAGLARALVERRLAACVSVLPGLRSIYRWEGRLDEASERLLLIKTDRALAERVRQTIRELHAYQVPEVLVLALQSGDPDYLRWLRGALDLDAGPARGRS
jgi:periplasmic divalent cation tolerance protein